MNYVGVKGAHVLWSPQRCVGFLGLSAFQMCLLERIWHSATHSQVPCLFEYFSVYEELLGLQVVSAFANVCMFHYFFIYIYHPSSNISLRLNHCPGFHILSLWAMVLFGCSFSIFQKMSIHLWFQYLGIYKSGNKPVFLWLQI